MVMWIEIDIKGDHMKKLVASVLLLLSAVTGVNGFEKNQELVDTFNFNNLKIIVLCNFQGSNNVSDIITSSRSPGYELTNAGLSMLQDVIPVLRDQHINYIYTSPVFRAQQTTNLLGKALNMVPDQLLIDGRLGMQNFGSAEGENYDVYKSRFTGLQDMLEDKPPNGEAGTDVHARTEEFLTSLNTLENQTVVVITHAFNFCHISKILTGKYGNVPSPGTYLIYDFND